MTHHATGLWSSLVKKLPSTRSSYERLVSLVSRNRWILVAIAIFFLATASFMWPMFSNVSTYSDGGDHMFNAWTLARDHHCILRQGCEQYANGNIFFPHKDTMLYSETQISAGVLTLPLFFINQNPLFAVNVWYILSAFLAGFFMYLLVRYLSKGNQPLSILAGLVFEFAPSKITSMAHLQNLSIFYLPLIILLLLKYRDKGQKRYLVGFWAVSSLLFLASWYQMVFGMVVILVFILYVLMNNKRRAGILLAATMLAVLTTLPLAKEYIRFSKSNQASFSIANQIQFSSSIDDYLTPYEGTPLGAAYYEARPNIQKNSYNPDNYSYAGITLYGLMAVCFLSIFLTKRKKSKNQKDTKRLIVVLCVLFVIGFVFSLGPVVKIGNQYIFHIGSFETAIVAPYILVDKFLPQLSFIRAVGRASVISLFALCCLLGVVALLIKQVRSPKKRILITMAVIILVSLDLLPVKQLISGPSQQIDPNKTSYSVPAVYNFIKNSQNVDNLIVLRTQKDYSYAGVPVAIAEDVMWSGYHNKNIFNGYSGYEPPEYAPAMRDFIDLQADDALKMSTLGIRYVLVDKQLSSIEFLQKSTSIFHTKAYEDSRYLLFKITP